MARTETAWIDVRQVVADRTEDDLFLDFADGCDKAIGFFLRSSEHMKGQTLRRFVTDAGQAFEFIYEFCYRFCVIKHIRLSLGLRQPRNIQSAEGAAETVASVFIDFASAFVDR